MLKTNTLLEIGEEACREAMFLVQGEDIEAQVNSYSKKNVRELKSPLDRAVEDVVIKVLAKSGLPILSEELNGEFFTPPSGLCWVVDPIDGTLNLSRNLGPCAVSIGLYRDSLPYLGMIGEFDTNIFSFGGKQIGAFRNGSPIEVSKIHEYEKAVICTGLPSRFSWHESEIISLSKLFTPYGKVRMLGCASLSLLKVAMGCAEVYFESNIMNWDVAAGLAIVEGAGGIISLSPGQHTNSFEVFVSNGNFNV